MSAIIIYFSRNGENYYDGDIKYIEKGNTKIIANYINEITSAKLFEIKMIKPYSDNYETCVKEAKNDLENNIKPALIEPLPKMDGIDLIYLGYPNYHNTLPMPVVSFLEKINTDKKIIRPFCTHEGLKLGESIKKIEKLCPNAEILPAFVISGHEAATARRAVLEWI